MTNRRERAFDGYSGRLDYRRPLLDFRPEETIEFFRTAADRLGMSREQ